uniref:DUF3074 domain-containing protein n=1 Tax=Candidozyma auris TaxID=498019 RepID=A0A0L0P906_CANAR
MNSVPLKSIDHITSLSLFQQAQDIARHIPQWHKAGTYKYLVPQERQDVHVDIHTKSFNDDYWVARASDFHEFSPKTRAHVYQLLDKYVVGSLSVLEESHTHYEMGYIQEMYDFKVHQHELAEAVPGFDSITYLAELYYHLQFPLKKRKFCNLVHILRAHDGKSAYIISLAVDPSVIPGNPQEPDFVQGRYTSVEYVEFDPKLSDVKWYMTTCSDAGGSVPQWLAKLTINSVVAKDVHLFLAWANTK